MTDGEKRRFEVTLHTLEVLRHQAPRRFKSKLTKRSRNTSTEWRMRRQLGTDKGEPWLVKLGGPKWQPTKA